MPHIYPMVANGMWIYIWVFNSVCKKQGDMVHGLTSGSLILFHWSVCQFILGRLPGTHIKSWTWLPISLTSCMWVEAEIGGSWCLLVASIAIDSVRDRILRIRECLIRSRGLDVWPPPKPAYLHTHVCLCLTPTYAHIETPYIYNIHTSTNKTNRYFTKQNKWVACKCLKWYTALVLIREMQIKIKSMGHVHSRTIRN